VISNVIRSIDFQLSADSIESAPKLNLDIEVMEKIFISG
jgi:hypothetical protein